jgi:4-carboxymuconolactone decarboxylase
MKGGSMENTSQMIQKLYGDYSSQLVDRLNDLSPELNQVIQNVAYEQFWRRPGLDLKTKSLITVTSLVALGKHEQLKIHMRGFLNCGGTHSELENVFVHLIVYCGFPAVMNAFSVLKELSSEQ